MTKVQTPAPGTEGPRGSLAPPDEHPSQSPFRSRRLDVEELHVPGLRAHGQHAGLGRFEAAVANVSPQGLALVLRGSGAREPLVLAGDRLDAISLTHAWGTLQAGQAVVRRTSVVEGDLVIGVEVEGGLDLGELSRQGVRSGFAERWRALLHQSQPGAVGAEFRLWVNDVRAVLAPVQAFLDEEERRLEREDRLTRLEAEREYLGVAAPYVVKLLNEACARLDGLVGHLSAVEHDAHRAYLKAHLSPFVTRSPFGRRAVEKPLGYAGDFEMLGMIDRSGPDGLGALAEGSSLFGRLFNLFCIQLAVARAHHNRLDYLGGLLRRSVAAAEAGRRVRVASIGCGPASELAALLTASPDLGERLDVALLDHEERALAHCERTLGPLASRTGLRCQYVSESVRQLVMTRHLSGPLGQRDLIYSAGLFDYLNERTFRSLLERLHGVLAPGGLLVIGNVADTNPSRWAMEYLLDWFLIGRTPAQLCELAGGLEPAPSAIEVGSEPLGVNLFLHVRR